MKFHETEEFKRQQKEWYEKLKQSGFKDIEYNERRLRDNSFLKEIREDTFDYYRQLMFFVSQTNFENKSHEIIMTRRAEGTKIKEISFELKTLGLPFFNRETIRYIIRRYEVLWGMREYSRVQLSSIGRYHGK